MYVEAGPFFKPKMEAGPFFKPKIYIEAGPFFFNAGPMTSF